MLDTPIVDAHHHIWDLRAIRYPWLSDAPVDDFFLGDYTALRRDYLPGDYRRDSVGLGVVKTVHCEAECDRGQQLEESHWLHSMHEREGLPDAIVAHSWLHTAEAAAVLEAQSRLPLVRGIRSKPLTAASADAERPRGPGSMADPRWREGLALLGEFGLSYDLRVPWWHLAEAAEVLAGVDHIPVVLNHTGFPWDRSEAGLAAWRGAMQVIAACPQVHLKVSEFGLRDAPWDYDSNRRVVYEAIEIFGIERCMFASNFPVAGLRVSYRQLVEDLSRMLADLARSERQAFFHDNASGFYRL